jgi:hypothetical protein
MKKTIILLCACACLVSAGGRVYGQSPEDMQKWMDYMTPGDMQKMLAEQDGQWKEEVTMWMAPGRDPMKSDAMVVNSMILGGRYQQTISTGSFGGMPFEGRSTIGYDKVKKLFVSSWIDNMGTGLIYMEGPYDAATKTITLTGMETDPMSGKQIKARQTMKYIDDKTQLIEMYSTQGAKEFKSMEIKLTRI